MNRARLVSVLVALSVILLALAVNGGHASGQLAAAAPEIQAQEPASPQTVITLAPSQIAWVGSATSTTSFGGQGYAWVGYGMGTTTVRGALRGLLLFNLANIPAGAVVSDARLDANVTADQGSANAFNYDVGEALTLWTQAVTWNTKPSIQYHGIPSAAIAATSGPVSWDVTRIVEFWLDDGHPNYGFGLRRWYDTDTNPDEQARRLGDFRMVVTYSLPTPTRTPTRAPTATPTPTLSGLPLLEITKTDEQDPVAVGANIAYNLRVRNLSGSSVTPLRLIDTLPPGASFVEASDGGTFDERGFVTWSLSAIPAGGSKTVRLVVRAPSPAGRTITNVAAITYLCPGQVIGIPTTCKKEVTETTTISMGLAPSPTPSPTRCVDEAGSTLETSATIWWGPGGQRTGNLCPAGDIDHYRFPVNVGDTIEAVLSNMTDDFDLALIQPSGSVVKFSATEGLGDERVTLWAHAAGDWRVSIYGHSHTTQVGPQTGSYLIQVQVWPPTATPTRTLTPTRTRTPPPPTGTPSRTPTRTRTPTPTRTPASNLSIDKRLVTTDLVAGEIAEYSILVTNNGAGNAYNVVVSDDLPSARSVFVSAAPIATLIGNPVTSVRWPAIPTLGPGQSRSFSVRVRVNPDVPAGETLRNTANVTADGVASVSDSSVDAVAAPSLTLSPGMNPDPVVAGGRIIINATLSNFGPGRAQGVEVRVKLPTGMRDPEGFAPPGATWNSSNRTVTWSHPDLAANGWARFSVDVEIDPALTAGTVLRPEWTARATGVPYVTVTQEIEVEETMRQNVSISTDQSESPIKVNDSFRLDGTVTIAGDNPLHHAKMRFVLPTYATVISWSDGCTNDPGNRRVDCTLTGQPGSQSDWIRLTFDEYVEQGAVTVQVLADELPSPVAMTRYFQVAIDLVADALEVTQAVQDLNNSVRLIKSKYTVVRFHVHGEVIQNGVTARLWRIVNGQRQSPPLTPANTGGVISVRISPDRAVLDDSFLFELPDSWVNGATLVLEAEVNDGHSIFEDNYANNTVRTSTLQLHASERLKVRLFNVRYTSDNGGTVTTSTDNYPYIEAWLRAAYPIPDVDISIGATLRGPWTGQGTCGEINNVLIEEWIDDGSPADTVYFAISSGVPYGCSYVPSNVATGAADWYASWDPDGYMADWYAGHEIGHSRGMDHVCNTLSAQCGEVPDPPCEPYPYASRNGSISPADTGRTALYGFDTGNNRIYPPSSKDVMTYCNNEWISDYTYEKLHDFIAAQAEMAGAQVQPEAGERLRVIASIDLDTDTIQVGSLARVVESWPLTEQAPGTYSLRLLGAGNAILAQHPFTPTVASAGCGQGGGGANLGQIYLVVPWAAGTQRIAIYHDATELIGRNVSANTPAVTVTYPNGGEVLGTAPFTITWTAVDADADPLSFAIQYSRDAGQIWQTIARRITETHHAVDPTGLSGSTHTLIRVVASDGVNLGRDTSDAVFQVGNRPPVAHILSPQDDSSHVQTALTLRGVGRDLEDGVLTGPALAWVSDRDGPLGTGAAVTVYTPTVGLHHITLTATDSGGLTDTAAITVEITSRVPPPDECRQWLINGDFEAAGWAGWAHGGTPEPIITAGTPATGTQALLLAPASGPDRPGLSWVRQITTLPATLSHARLVFRYRVGSSDPGDGYDWFIAAVTGGEGDPVRAIQHQNGPTDWQTITADLSAYAGQTIGILFAVHNDGQAGHTWALVDDVLLCVSAAPADETGPGACNLPGELADYAPAGLPDFDQQQGGWQDADTGRWTHDGPTALADLLWWRDAMAEPGVTAPPAVSDGHGLVRTYGTWDDHDAQNVRPLVDDLAARMLINTDHPGADLDDLVTGLGTYLGSMGVADQYSIAARRTPSFDWVRDAARQNHQVLLLLGFWELQPGGWRRLGGHYVAVSGASCRGDEEWIAFSDPFRDSAEAGWPGRVVPAPPHGHPVVPPDTVHNDAAYVSHDLYGVTRTSGGWGPQGYIRNAAEAANFLGLNFAPALEAVRAAAYGGGDITTLVDYAVVLAPQPAGVALRVAPALSQVRAAERFSVELELQADRPADQVRAFLNFDPAVLRVVDTEGNAANQIVPGAAFGTVTVNTADNATGRISFVAGGDPADGRILVATVHFRAITTTLLSRLTWNTAAPRLTDVTSGGASILGSAQPGAVRVAPTSLLTGQTVMQGRAAAPNAAWSVPLLLTLGQPGERGPDYVFGMQSDQSGAFAMPGVAAPDGYNLRLKGLHTLRSLLPRTLAGGLNAVNWGTLLEGDVYNDNRIDGRDVSLLAAAFGKAQGQAGFDPRADLNEDDTINNADVNLLRANLGRRGDVLAGAQVAGSRFKDDEVLSTLNLQPSTATGGVSLTLAPTVTLASVGDTIVLEVIAAAGTQTVDSAELHLDYNPAALRLVDGAGAPATAVEAGSSLETILQNSVNGASGWVDFVASSMDGTPPSGQFTLARLRFQVLAPQTSWVRFSFSGSRPTDVVYRGESVLGSVAAARVQALAANMIYLPIVLK